MCLFSVYLCTLRDGHSNNLSVPYTYIYICIYTYVYIYIYSAVWLVALELDFSLIPGYRVSCITNAYNDHYVYSKWMENSNLSRGKAEFGYQCLYHLATWRTLVLIERVDIVGKKTRFIGLRLRIWHIYISNQNFYTVLNPALVQNE